MAVKLVILVIILGLSFAGALYLIRDYNKAQKDAEMFLRDITKMISEIKTVSDCDNIKGLIAEKHDNTDSLYKDIRDRYFKVFWMVEGKRSMLLKKEESHEN